MPRVKPTRIGNKYNQTIWVKVDVEEKYISMSGGRVEGNVNVAGAGAGVGVQHCCQVEWKKVKAEFNPIQPGHRQKFDMDSKGRVLVYITIVANDGNVLCNALSRELETNLVVTEKGQVVTAKEKDPFIPDEQSATVN